MNRRSFLTAAALTTLSSAAAFAITSQPSNLDQWLKINQNSTGLIKLKQTQAVDKISQLSELIKTPIHAKSNKLTFEYLGVKHELTIKIVI